MKKLYFLSFLLSLALISNAQKWTEIKKFLPDAYTNNAEDDYGWTVAIDGDYAVIGSHGYNNNHGCIYVLYNDGTNWEQVARLTASDSAANNYFGISLDIAGDIIVVGSENDTVYVYEKPVSGWVDATETAKLTSSIGGGNFGCSVGISGDVIVVGANMDQNNGAAYIFLKPVSDWTDGTEDAKLTTSDLAYLDGFGGAVSISGDLIIVGAKNDDDNGSFSGSAYIFEKPVTGWVSDTETAKLLPSDGSADAKFGKSVSISGGVAIVGAYDRCYIYIEPVSGWANATESCKLGHKFINPISSFGESVCINGDKIIMGVSSLGNGWVYIFDKPVAGWTDTTETDVIYGATSGESFGSSVGISGNLAFIGAEGCDDNGTNVGATYLFESLPNNDPTDLALSNNEIDENSPINSVVGGFSTADVDTNDTFEYSLIAGDGTNDADNDKFFIGIEDSLQISIIPDYEKQTSYNIYVQTDDGWGGIIQEAFVITVNDLADSVNIDTTICPYSHVVFDDKILMDTGSYKEITQSVNGYDSITMLNIYHYPNYNYTDTIFVCQGDSVMVHGEYQPTDISLYYYLDSNTIHGCDSNVNTLLYVNYTFLSEPSRTICEGDSVLLYGKYYKEAGTFIDSFQTLAGCDSIYIVNITINDVPTTNIVDTICPGDSIEIGGTYYKTAGTYIDTIPTILGCDSILSITISLYPEMDIELSDTVYACDGNEMWFSVFRFEIETYYWSNYLGATSDSTDFIFTFNHANPPSSVYCKFTDSIGCSFEKNIRIIDNEVTGGGVITINYSGDPEISVDFVNNFSEYDSAYWSLEDYFITQPATSDNITYTYTENGDYRVCYVVRNTCGEDSICTSIFTINNATGDIPGDSTENISIAVSGDIELFPNPTTGEFELSNITPGTMIEISDVTGKSIFREAINSDSFKYSLINQEAGLYIVHLTNNGITKEIKLLLVK
ncbi:T9SS type A sorting domain-containing protein [Bacteroidota bacterium]